LDGAENHPRLGNLLHRTHRRSGDIEVVRALENKGSGYSLSDYKQILEKIYVDARHDESRALAKINSD
jgi:hypothetical protein